MLAAAKKKRNNGERQPTVASAAALLKVSKPGNVSVHQAMKLVGFATPLAKDKTLQKRVYRQRDQLETPSVLSGGRFKINSTIQQVVVTIRSDFQQSADPELRQMQKLKADVKAANMRLSYRQKQGLLKSQQQEKKRKDDLFKGACLAWKKELETKASADEKGEAYRKVSPEIIVKEILEKEGVKLCARSIRNYGKSNKLGAEPERRGEKGRIPFRYYKALCAAVMTYNSLASQLGTIVVDRPRLVRMVNACVNRKEGGGKRNNRKLFERIQRDTADTMDIGKPNRVEQRRNRWGTYYQLNLWYDSLKQFLIEQGFGSANETNVEELGEIVWTDDTQAKRIWNIDETAVALDNTANGKGGRPAATFYNPRLQQAATLAAHKSSYHCTLVAGAFASGEKLPDHFQLPTDAENKENEGIPIEFIEHMHETVAEYLDGKEGRHSNTYGVNKKGGMNSSQFAEYIQNNILPCILADTADVAGKRSVGLVDGGPGRGNTDLLADCAVHGVHLFPSGPPNTTHILQVSKDSFVSRRLLRGAQSMALTQSMICCWVVGNGYAFWNV